MGLLSTVSIIVVGAVTRIWAKNVSAATILLAALAAIFTGLVVGFVEYYDSLSLLILGGMLYGLFSCKYSC